MLLNNLSKSAYLVQIILVATSFAVPQCPNGTIEKEDAASILDYINQARMKLKNGLQNTLNGALLPPAVTMNELEWDCEIEKRLDDFKTPHCRGDTNPFGNFVIDYEAEDGKSVLDYIRENVARIENEAPTNITNDAVIYNDINALYEDYNLFNYLNLMRATTQKFACIVLGVLCTLPANNKFWCATDQADLENGDIVYEIAPATTSVTTTAKATNSVATTAKATASVATTAKATTNVATTIIASLKTVATSSTTTSPNAKSHITQCASASTTSSCITQSPRRVRREAKAALFENFLMKKPASAKKDGKPHHKQLRNMPMTLTAHRTHAAKTVTGEN